MHVLHVGMASVGVLGTWKVNTALPSAGDTNNVACDAGMLSTSLHTGYVSEDKRKHGSNCAGKHDSVLRF